MQTSLTHIAEYVDAHVQAVRALPPPEIERVLDVIRRARAENRTVFIFGNGGSATTASHMVCDLAKNSLAPDGGIRALALTDSLGLLTAWANDYGYETIFAAQLRNLVRAGDLVIAISGSGNSANVIGGVELAKAHGAITVGLTGFDGGKLGQIADYALVVPSFNMQIVEDVHLMLVHLFMTCLSRSPASDTTAPQAVQAVPTAPDR